MVIAVPLSRFTSLVGGGSAFFVRRIRRRFIMFPFFALSSPSLVIEDQAAEVAPFHALFGGDGIVEVLARRAGLILWVVVTLCLMQQAGVGFGVSVFALVVAVFAFVGCYHSFVSVDHPPNKSPEPMRVIAFSSAIAVG